MIKKAIRWLNVNFEPFFGMIAFFGMLTIIVMQIVLRNVFGAGTAWGEEICRFCYVWVCYIGLGYATHNNTHITIDVVRRKLPVGAQKAVVIIAELIMLLVFVRLFSGTLTNVIRVADLNSRASSINISQNWMYVAGPVGYGLGVFRVLQSLVWKFRHIKCSWDLFINSEGKFSGAIETYCYPESVRQEMRDSITPELQQEFEEFEAKHGRKKKEA